MNIEDFKAKYAAFKDAEQIQINCDHPQHEGEIVTIGKQPAKRNILKNDGKQFICRKCMMRHNNPMNHIGEKRHTDEVIDVLCPHPDHEGEAVRQMKKNCYYGGLSQPYLQLCGSCVQRGKTISEEQKIAISAALTGIVRSDEFKQRLSEYMKNNPQGIATASANLIPGAGGGWNAGLESSEETKKKQSETMTGRIYSEEHKQNISEGRKKMLDEQGGFTIEHREKLSKATIAQYQAGFDPNTHFLSGYHESPKAGKIFYRSSYEKKAYLKLDADDSVKCYRPENITVEYHHPIKQITSTYLIDIDVEYIDGTRCWVEVKPLQMLTDVTVQAKVLAAENKAKETGLTFLVWTEMDLFGHVYNERNMRAFAEKVRNGEI